MYSVQCTMYNVHCTVYNVQCTMYSVQCTITLKRTVGPVLPCWPLAPALGAVQCNAVQCSAVQCSAVQCSAVQCSTVQWLQPRRSQGGAISASCNEWSGGARWCSAVQCSAVQCSGQGSVVQGSVVQCSAWSGGKVVQGLALGRTTINWQGAARHGKEWCSSSGCVGA
jgi:hypothetical protein